MTDYALDDVVSVQTNCASLSQGKFIVAASPLTSPAEPHIISYRRYSIAPAFAHNFQADIFEEERLESEEPAQGHGTIVQTAAQAMVATVRSGRLVRWRSLKGYDVKNVVIARSGPGIQNTFWANSQTQYSYEEPIATEARAVLLSEQVIDFCYQYQLSNWLQVALRQVRHHFSTLLNLHVEVERDRESDDQWLTIIAEVRANPEALFAMYNNYTKAMLNAVPWPARDKMRLIYDII